MVQISGEHRETPSSTLLPTLGFSPLPAAAPDEWLTLSEVAQTLKVGRTTIWRCRREGLKAMRRGGLVRVRRSDLNAYLERHQN
jgi:excisionase family DNA binding protein